MFVYIASDAQMCFRYISFWGGHNHIVFMGDSRIRQLYHEFIDSLPPNGEPRNADDESIPIHHDMQYQEKSYSLLVKFIWMPVVNGSMVKQFKIWNSYPEILRPNIVITGSATHSIKQTNASLLALEHYRRNLTVILPYLDNLNQTTKILWMLQDPVEPKLLAPVRKMITNEQIDAYNKAAMEVIRYSRAKSVQIWSSARLVVQGYQDAISDPKHRDGLHINSHALKFSIQILLNLYCNDHMNYNDGTCCSDPEKFTIVQKLFFFTLALFVITAFFVYLFNDLLRKNGKISRSYYSSKNYKWTRLRTEEIELQAQCRDGPFIDPSMETAVLDNFKTGKNNDYMSLIKDFMSNLAILGIIMFYFFLCDRTNFFMKENKYFTRPNFILPIAYVFALGLFFTDESNYSTMLHRDQTDEMKGWMQLIILSKFLQIV